MAARWCAACTFRRSGSLAQVQPAPGQAVVQPACGNGAGEVSGVSEKRRDFKRERVGAGRVAPSPRRRGSKQADGSVHARLLSCRVSRLPAPSAARAADQWSLASVFGVRDRLAVREGDRRSP